MKIYSCVVGERAEVYFASANTTVWWEVDKRDEGEFTRSLSDIGLAISRTLGEKGVDVFIQILILRGWSVNGAELQLPKLIEVED